MIKTVLIAAAMVLSMGIAMAQSITQADVGSFVRDGNGEVIGSLKAIHGDQAVVWYGFFNTPGNHLETIPLSALGTHGGKLVLNNTSAKALAAR